MSNFYTTAGISPEAQDRLRKVEHLRSFLESYLMDHGARPYSMSPIEYELYYDMFLLGVYFFSTKLANYLTIERMSGVVIMAAMNEIIETIKKDSENVH